MKIKGNINENLETIKKEFGNTPEIVIRQIKKDNKDIAYIYFESVSSDDKISNFLMKSINNIESKSLFNSLYNTLNNEIANSHLITCDEFEKIFNYLSSGFTCIFVEKSNKAIIVETKSELDRGVTESTTERTIRGPKDSFGENHVKNLGLIRKRIKDKNLWFKETKVGRRTQTKVTVAYIKDIAIEEHVTQIMDKLKKIDIDSIIDSGYIRELLQERQTSAFPKVISTEKPDLACMALLNGKIVILVENSPFVLVLPAVLIDFVHSPEDYCQNPPNVTFSRVLRVLCFLLTIVVPGLYVALMTFNHEIIPEKLLISLAIQREGVPFSTATEIIIFIIIFEMLREADVHAPSAAGSTMSIVGTLILGDASVAAGIVSPIVIIVIAITSICELVFYDIDMINAVRQWRILFVIAAMTLGVIGIFIISIIFVAKLTSLECLGTPYIAPISPLKINELKDSLIRVSRRNLIKRPSYLTDNLRRIKDEKNNS